MATRSLESAVPVANTCPYDKPGPLVSMYMLSQEASGHQPIEDPLDRFARDISHHIGHRASVSMWKITLDQWPL